MHLRRVARRPALRIDRDAFGQHRAAALLENQVRTHERRGTEIDDKRLIQGRKSKRNRIGARCGTAGAGRRHMGPAAHAVDTNQAGAGTHLDVVRAAAAHPGIVHANSREAMLARLRDRDLRRAVHRHHAVIVAAVEQRRHRGLAQHAQRPARLPQLAMLGDV